MLPAPSSLTSTLYGAMSNRIAAAGGRIKAVLGHHGETDAKNGVSAATYEAGVLAIATDINTRWGAKYMQPLLQFCTDSLTTPAEQDAINAGVIALRMHTAYIHANGPDFRSLTSDDGFHAIYTANQVAMGVGWANALRAEFGYP